MWSHTVRQRKNKTSAINQGKASEMLAHLVREHSKTSQARKNKKNKNCEDKKKPTGVLKDAMQQDQKGCTKNNIRAEGEQTTAARTKHEGEEEDTGIRPAGTEK